MATPRTISKIETILVFGVSGSGKSTLGSELAARIGFDFVDADDLHSFANIEKMKAGIALTDAEREPWLSSVAALIQRRRAEGRPVVVACSALKRMYRDRLIGGRRGARLFYLYLPRNQLLSRMSGRRQHFMPLSLLDSQLLTLEPPEPSEGAVSIDTAQPLDSAVACMIDALRE